MDILSLVVFIFAFLIITFFSIIMYQAFFEETNGTVFTGKASDILTAHQNNIATLDYATLFLTIGLLAGLFISGYFINSHPIFLVITIIIGLFDLIIGVILTNTFDSIVQLYPTIATSLPISVIIAGMFPLIITIGIVLFGIGIYSKPVGQVNGGQL